MRLKVPSGILIFLKILMDVKVLEVKPLGAAPKIYQMYVTERKFHISLNLYLIFLFIKSTFGCKKSRDKTFRGCALQPFKNIIFNYTLLRKV